MEQKTFNYVIEKQMEQCKCILITKGTEYAPNALADSQIDRLNHFKKAAMIMGVTPQAALMGMLTKHLISITDMCMDEKKYSIEKWDEKITDSINYLFILRAIIEEEASEKN